MIINQYYSRKYIVLGTVIFVISIIVGATIHSYLGWFVFIISIGLYAHKVGIGFDRKNRKLGFFSQFYFYKTWTSLPVNIIENVTIESKAQSIENGSQSGDAGDESERTMHNYLLTIKTKTGKPYYYSFPNYKDAKTISDFFSKKYKINVKNYVEEAQIKALKTRKLVEERRQKRLKKN